MKKNEIKIGETYRVRLHGNFTRVKVNDIVERDEWCTGRYQTRYLCTNLATGRRVEIKSAAKFRGRVDERFELMKRTLLRAQTQTH